MFAQAKSVLTDTIRNFYTTKNIQPLIEWNIPPEGIDADLSYSGALQTARQLGCSPVVLAKQLEQLLSIHTFVKTSVVGPGYINVVFQSDFICEKFNQKFFAKSEYSLEPYPIGKTLIDFGGPNIKPMHVGHMRSIFLGESLRRMLLETGNQVISDIHLGDWGLPSGMILGEIFKTYPQILTVIPSKLPFSYQDLAIIYPRAVKACKENLEQMQKAREITANLQSGNEHLTAVWARIVSEATNYIQEICDRMEIHFDLWEGESSVQHMICSMIKELEPYTFWDQGDLCIDISLESDKEPMPAIILKREDGSALYAATDLATIKKRQQFDLKNIWYVVDQRQSLHFKQVFRAAEKTGLSNGIKLEHIGFGTINGKDNKPYKTRQGDVQGLESLINQASEKAELRLKQNLNISSDELRQSSEKIGLSALKIYDLSNPRNNNYRLDLDDCLAFEGFTGAYLQYTIVRINKLLPVNPSNKEFIISHVLERDAAIAALSLDQAVCKSIQARSAHHLVKWAFGMASIFNRFYAECPIISDQNLEISQSRLTLCHGIKVSLAKALYLLGCSSPEQM